MAFDQSENYLIKNKIDNPNTGNTTTRSAIGWKL
jgi:hypothetical protein